jgi:long-chain acyl-CoA synthetase
MSSPPAPPLADIHWKGSPEDRRALAAREDWSWLEGLEQLWPELDQRHGDALALDAPHAHPPERFSFRQLRQGIERAAAGFAALGVRPGDVVALFAENGPRWLVADQGLMRAGAADAVRGSGAPDEELLYILEDSGAVGLVLESVNLLRRLDLPQEARQRLRFVVVLEGDGSADDSALPCCSWEELLEKGADGALPPLPGGGPDRLATLLYTSGTTGQPKGVPLSHANLLHQLGTLGVAVAPHPGDQVLSVLPIWHAYERTAEYFLLACGCRQTYTTLKQLRKDLQQVRPQYLISVPRLWEAILSGFEDALAAMPPSRQRLLGVALANSRRYGLSCRIARISPSPRGTPAPACGQRWRLQCAGSPIDWRRHCCGRRCGASWWEVACERRSAAAVPWRSMWTAFSKRSALSCWWATASRKPALFSPADGRGATVAAAPANRCRIPR